MGEVFCVEVWLLDFSESSAELDSHTSWLFESYYREKAFQELLMVDCLQGLTRSYRYAYIGQSVKTPVKTQMITGNTPPFFFNSLRYPSTFCQSSPQNQNGEGRNRTQRDKQYANHLNQEMVTEDDDGQPPSEYIIAGFIVY
ncbi:hypothetical protein ACTXT7_010948 [Hymenolepis weldensis]